MDLEQDLKPQEPDLIEIVEDLLKPDYFDKKSIIKIASPWKLHCLTFGSHRLYWEYDQEMKPTMFTGVGTFLDQVLPPKISGEKYLRNWAIDNFQDVEDYKLFMNTAAVYGSFLHWQIKEFCERKYVDYSTLRLELELYMEENQISRRTLFNRWLQSAMSDLISFQAFVKAYNVQIIGVEFPIAGDFGAASRIDLICIMDVPLKKDGTPYSVYPKKTDKVRNWLHGVLAIGDIKSKLYSSNRGTFFPRNGYQLYAYRRLWNNAYGKLPGLNVDFLFNWSPSNRTESFHFRPWTKVKVTNNETTMSLEDASFEDSVCSPELLDDYISLNRKWFAGKSSTFKRVVFDRIELYGEIEYRYEDIIDFAVKYGEKLVEKGTYKKSKKK